MIFSKGKKSVELISDHIDMVAQCIRTAERAVESYIDGNLSGDIYKTNKKCI